MKKLSFLLCSLLLFGSLAGLSPEALYGKMQKAYGSFSSFQANVKQDNHFAQINKSISYSGKIYFSQGRMVIRYDKPAFQRLQISGGLVELYDAGSKTVFRSRMRPEFGKMNPVEILQLYWGKSKVSVSGEKNGVSTVSLKPSGDPMIVSLSAKINNKTGIVDYLSYTDPNGNKVGYSFSGIKTNAAIPASVWKYTYPKGTQVVEQ